MYLDKNLKTIGNGFDSFFFDEKKGYRLTISIVVINVEMVKGVAFGVGIISTIQLHDYSVLLVEFALRL